MGSHIIGGFFYVLKILLKGIGLIIKGALWYISNLFNLLSSKEKTKKNVSIEGEIL